MGQTMDSLVVMGVAGCGKSSVAEALAASIGGRLIEGDAFHPSANVEKMRRGIPLSDADRAGWLDRLAAELARVASQGERAVLACSALKRRYRDRLRDGTSPLGFVFLDLPPAEAERRVGQRAGHFMPKTLVDSQFADLEPPVTEAFTLAVDATCSLTAIVNQTLAWWAQAIPDSGFFRHREIALSRCGAVELKAS
ncbi:gluconokinase [Paraburkholderia sp. IW21]|uniref:gluconokinase n=1 Tax=Paraburkholderia sp. IW21 TaxID=3242488 RepID=UPI00351FED89